MRCLAFVALILLALIACTSDSDEEDLATPGPTFDAPDLPPPITQPTLTREQALFHLAMTNIIPPGAKPRAIDLQATTHAGASSLMGGYFAGDQTETKWAVRARFEGDNCPSCYMGGAPPSEAYEIACREFHGYFNDEPQDTGGGTSSGPPLPDSDCDFAMTSDVAIIVAARAVSVARGYTDPRDIEVIQTTFAEARNQASDRGALDIPNDLADSHATVWLVTFGGAFSEPRSTSDVPSNTPRPTTPPTCRLGIAIISNDATALFADSAECPGVRP